MCQFFRHEADSPPKQTVRLDWISAEDGSHILTVGVGPKIFIYAAVSEDIAQRNIQIMKVSCLHSKCPLTINVKETRKKVYFLKMLDIL